MIGTKFTGTNVYEKYSNSKVSVCILNIYLAQNLKNCRTYDAEIWLRMNFLNSNFKGIKKGFICWSINF